MAQRHQVWGAFGALNPGDTGNREGVSLGHLPGAQRGEGLRRQQHPPGRARLADGHILARNVDHPGVPSLVKVCEATCLRHGSDITSATSPASIRTTFSGTTISALARASTPSWCEP